VGTESDQNFLRDSELRSQPLLEGRIIGELCAHVMPMERVRLPFCNQGYSLAEDAHDCSPGALQLQPNRGRILREGQPSVLSVAEASSSKTGVAS